MKSMLGGQTLRRLGIVSTLLDAAVAFARRDTRTAVVLLGAAIASKWVPGLGVAVSILTRLYRRIQRGQRPAFGSADRFKQGVVSSGMGANR